MKQTIEIEVPDGKIAVWEDGKLMFKDTKTPLPKTWLEFVKTQDYKNTQIITGVPEDITPQHIALIQLHKLRDCYRQGWRPTEGEKGEYAIIRSLDECGHFFLDVFEAPRFLTFPTRWLATEFLKNFRDLIEQAGDLI